jgi:hypothetical protein
MQQRPRCGGARGRGGGGPHLERHGGWWRAWGGRIVLLWTDQSPCSLVVSSVRHLGFLQFSCLTLMASNIYDLETRASCLARKYVTCTPAIHAVRPGRVPSRKLSHERMSKPARWPTALGEPVCMASLGWALAVWLPSLSEEETFGENSRGSASAPAHALDPTPALATYLRVGEEAVRVPSSHRRSLRV